MAQADRFNTGKPELSYLLSAPYAIEGLCEAFTFGAKKYSRDNWKQGFPANQLINSLLRHLTAYANGDPIDEESGINHLNMVLWNALVLADEYNGLRPPKVTEVLHLEDEAWHPDPAIYKTTASAVTGPPV